MSNAVLNSSLTIADLATRVDAPGPDGVVVVEVIGAANRQQLGQRRLNIIRLIDGAALDDGGVAVPLPGHAEARQCTRQDRLLKLRRLPVLAAIDGNLDAL